APPAADGAAPPTTATTADTGSQPPSGPVAAERRPSVLARLAVVHDTNRPHGRIGLAWAVVAVAATIAGAPWLAAWLGAAAFVGASQAAGCRRALDQRPPPALAAVVAAALAAAAVSGGRAAALGVVAGLVLAGLSRTLIGNRRVAVNLSLAFLIGVAMGAAAAAPVLTREVGADAALYLLACACIYDASAYVVGTGAASAWEGPAAGIVALMPVTILAALVLVPPFPSGTPLALGLLAAVLAPLGPLVGTALLGRREADAPGLRRLDSLILLGPAWAWLVTVILK
ncbi:MAG: phosphatidate cytidylyltransferase, partial [Acidimicrobiales bacterium]